MGWVTTRAVRVRYAAGVSIVGLAREFRVLVPEIDRLAWPTEVKATCAACPRADTEDPPGPDRFLPDVRCCTYHPSLPNFLVGRVLAREDVGAAKMRARLRASRAGVTAGGVGDSWLGHLRYEADGRAGFGRDRRLTCPYWAEGALSCSIWRDRGAVCRTWFCRHEEGFVGRDAWLALRDALDAVELDLALAAVDAGDPPWPWAPVERFEAWYRWCAAWVDGLDDDALRAAVSPKVAGFRVLVATRVAARDQATPPRLACAAHQVIPRRGGASLVGHSSWDPVEVTTAEIGVATAFEEGRDVADVLAAIPPATADLVRRLWRAGVLVDD